MWLFRTDVVGRSKSTYVNTAKDEGGKNRCNSHSVLALPWKREVMHAARNPGPDREYDVKCRVRFEGMF